MRRAPAKRLDGETRQRLAFLERVSVGARVLIETLLEDARSAKVEQAGRVDARLISTRCSSSSARASAGATPKSA
jgi:hypothetical protein